MLNNIRNKRNKRFVELKTIASKIVQCDSNKEAMRYLNGLKNGYARKKEMPKPMIVRIKLLEELIKLYK